jgi:hypothetical protein
MNIKDLFSHDINRTIEEVVKVDQHNKNSVVNEISEYVITDSLSAHFETLLDEILRGIEKPREGIGVWVSGFFGSGKSLFAKMLAYIIENKELLGSPASQRFINQLEAQNRGDKIKNLLTAINQKLSFKTIIFDVSMDRGQKSGNERITEILYKKLLDELNYPTDFDLAALEIKLEAQGKLEAFKQKFEELRYGDWEDEKTLDPLNEASATLHAIDPNTYPSADSWSNTIGQLGRSDITPNLLAERAFELTKRRLPEHGLIFIIDEVGQYVARSEDKMLDLQSVIEAFGKEGNNRKENKEAPSPAWLIVTAQEKLNEVVSALDSKRIELGKVQDRFRLQTDINQADISEVTSKRVLSKKQDAIPTLIDLFNQNKDRLVQLTQLERSSRNLPLEESIFCNLYPYLPYQIDLCIDIVAGFRLRRGAHKHVGGSNRTIIKQAQEMMINPSTNMGAQPVGTLVTLDRVYDLLHLGNLLPQELQKEVSDIQKQIKHPFAEKVAKVIALLEPIKNLPRTATNISVLLHSSVEANSCLTEVTEAISELEKAQFIRESEDGYKLLTAQEKSWDTKRNERDPKTVERNRIRREALKEILCDPKVQNYTYNNIRKLKPSLSINNESIDTSGHFLLNVKLAEDNSELTELSKEARSDSNIQRNELFWVAALSSDTHALITEFYRSAAMVSEHELLSSQGKLTSDEIACLNDEKRRKDRFNREIIAKIRESLLSGSGFFQGVQKDASALGQSIQEVFHALFDHAIPSLYPKLEMGVLDVSDKDADTFLTSVNLQGLPQVFYNTDPAKALVVKEGGKMVANLNAGICKELFDYLRNEHSYGNKVTGKSIASHFSGIGYGWQRESIRLALAVLLRGGSIELTHQGRKYWNYSEQSCRVPFNNNNAFNAASFAPREALDLKILANAANTYEALTGLEVDIEEGAIAQAVKSLASEDREDLIPIIAQLKATGLPEYELVNTHLSTLDGILEMSSDDVVKTLAGEGKTFQTTRDQIKRIEQALTDENLKKLSTAKKVLSEQWPFLKANINIEELKESAEKLQSLFDGGEPLTHINQICTESDKIATRYQEIYKQLFEQRQRLYSQALDSVKGLADWAQLDEDPEINDEQRQQILQPLLESANSQLDLPTGATTCQKTAATIPQLKSDIAAVENILSQVIQSVEQLAAPEEKIERLKVSKLFKNRINSESELDEALAEIRSHAMKLIKQDIKVVLE